jgi:hypothetical protein
MAPPRLAGSFPAGEDAQPIPPAAAAELRRALGGPLYALLGEAELLVVEGREEKDAGKVAAGERILRLGRQLAGVLRELR